MFPASPLNGHHKANEMIRTHSQPIEIPLVVPAGLDALRIDRDDAVGDLAAHVRMAKNDYITATDSLTMIRSNAKQVACPEGRIHAGTIVSDTFWLTELCGFHGVYGFQLFEPNQSNQFNQSNQSNKSNQPNVFFQNPLHLFPEPPIQTDPESEGRHEAGEFGGVLKKSDFHVSLFLMMEIHPASARHLCGRLVDPYGRLAWGDRNDLIAFCLFEEENWREWKMLLDIPLFLGTVPQVITPRWKRVREVLPLCTLHDQGFVIRKGLPWRRKTAATGRFPSIPRRCQDHTRPVPFDQASVEGKPARLLNLLVDRGESEPHPYNVQGWIVFMPDLTNHVRHLTVRPELQGFKVTDLPASLREIIPYQVLHEGYRRLEFVFMWVALDEDEFRQSVWLARIKLCDGSKGLHPRA
jgi:hypothetical protein